MLLSGLSLSGIAAVYAIIGLMSIFPASPTTIMIMGSALEVSKLVVASWLYRNWKEIPVLLKTYFSIAIVVLMFLTSMSIFGFLSKAHMDSGVMTGESVTALAIVDERLTTEKENVRVARAALTQMDGQVNEMLTRTTDEHGTDKAIQLRKRQKLERAALNDEIHAAQVLITKLQSERAPLASTVRKVEAEVGPIKYIANLIYGDKIDDTLLERAVRWVILLIVFVFDPLAVLLLIAANWNLKQHQHTKTVVTKRHLETVEDTTEETLKDEDYAPIKLKKIPQDKLDAFREKLRRRKSVIDEFKTDEVKTDVPIDEHKIDEVKTEVLVNNVTENNVAHTNNLETSNEPTSIDILRNESEKTISDVHVPDTSDAAIAEDANTSIAIASGVSASDEPPHVHIK